MAAQIEGMAWAAYWAMCSEDARDQPQRMSPMFEALAEQVSLCRRLLELYRPQAMRGARSQTTA